MARCKTNIGLNLLVLALALGLVNSQGGFFSNIRNAVFGGGRPAGPPQNQRPPPGQPGQPGLPPQGQFPPQQQPQGQFPPQQQPQGQLPPQQQQGQFPPPQQQQQQFAPQQQQNFGPPAGNNPNVPVRGRGGEVNGCPVVEPNHQWQGQSFIATWLINGDGRQDNENDPCQKFTGEQAEEYCQLAGGHAVSLDTNEKAEHFMDQARQFAKRFFWTGGRINHSGDVVTWPSGRTEGIGAHGTRFWSTTGGAEPVKPQPDNRDGNEVCLAVLNNFYADGIKWHDVACHHKKPTFCEFGPPRRFHY